MTAVEVTTVDSKEDTGQPVEAEVVDSKPKPKQAKMSQPKKVTAEKPLSDAVKKRLEGLIDSRASMLTMTVTEIRDKLKELLSLQDDIRLEERTELETEKMRIQVQLDKAQMKEEEELRLVQEEIEKKYANRRKKLEDRKIELQNKEVDLSKEIELEKFKRRCMIDEYITALREKIVESKREATETVWTRCTTVGDAENALNLVPTSAEFRDENAGLLTAGPDALQRMLPAPDAVSSKMICTRCSDRHLEYEIRRNDSNLWECSQCMETYYVYAVRYIDGVEKERKKANE